MPNTLAQILKFLATDERPLKNSEFTEFWQGLTKEEQEEYKNAQLG